MGIWDICDSKIFIGNDGPIRGIKSFREYAGGSINSETFGNDGGNMRSTGHWIGFVGKI